VSNLVVVCADADAEAAVVAAGAAAFRHEGLGELGDRAAAGTFGDRAFVDAMWLKIAAVYLANMAGFDVLFVDADTVWFRDPWDALYAEDADSVWMDDGQHTPRFAPFFANTGFYLLKSTWRSEVFMAQLLVAYDVVIAWQSHQAVVNQFLAEAHSQAGLGVAVLDRRLFVAGAYKNALRAQLDAGDEPQPVVFHVNFTAKKADKLRALADLGLWFLPADCDALADAKGCLDRAL
jgi:hypothetical protein